MSIAPRQPHGPSGESPTTPISTPVVMAPNPATTEQGPGAVVTAAAPVSEWRPIETAPKDGTAILLWRDDAGVFLGRWIAPCDFLNEGEFDRQFTGRIEDWEEPDWFGADFIAGYRISNDGIPTHWMPLPPPPASHPTTV